MESINLTVQRERAGCCWDRIMSWRAWGVQALGRGAEPFKLKGIARLKAAVKDSLEIKPGLLNA